MQLMQFGALAEFPWELVYFQGISFCILGDLNFWDSWVFDSHAFNASRNICIFEKISSIDIEQKSATRTV